MQITSSGFVFRAAAQIVVFNNSRQALLSVNCPKNGLSESAARDCTQKFSVIPAGGAQYPSISLFGFFCLWILVALFVLELEISMPRAVGQGPQSLICFVWKREELSSDLIYFSYYLPCLCYTGFFFPCTLDNAWLAAARKIRSSIVLPLIMESSR